MMIGADPELFLRRKHTPVPAHLLFPDKYHKKDVGKGVTAFRDGYAVELNPAACHTPKELALSMQAGIKGINKIIAGEGLSLFTSPAIEINLARDLRDAPEDVKHFGCEPSYCAYTGASKVPQINAWEHKYRYGGAHMHFSVSPAERRLKQYAWLKDKANHLLFIRMLDYHLGLPLACILHGPGQYLRRKYYGQAGEFRPQEYPDGSVGLEYRTPPPELWNNYELAAWGFHQGMKVFANFEIYKKGHDKEIEPAIRAAIDHGTGRQKLLNGAYEDVCEKFSKDSATRGFTLPLQVLA